MVNRMTGSWVKPSRPPRDGSQSNGVKLHPEQPDLFGMLPAIGGETTPSTQPRDGGLLIDRQAVARANRATDTEAHRPPALDSGTGSEKPGTGDSTDLNPMPDYATSVVPAQTTPRILPKRGRPTGGRKPISKSAMGSDKPTRKQAAENTPTQERVFLSVHSVALRYDASVATIWRWPKTRGFPKPRKIGRLTRWALADLEAFDQAKSNT